MRSDGTPAETFIQSARREQITATAIEVIAEIGWAATSIRKIADRVGIAMSAVLYHVGSKDKLVEAVIEHMYREAIAIVAPAIDDAPTATGKLIAYIRASIGYFDTHRANLAALSDLAATYRPSDGRRFDELGVAPDIRERLSILDPTAILMAGQRDGEFANFPIASTTLALRGAVNAAVEKILHDNDFDASAYAEDLVGLFTQAVGAHR